VSYTPSPAWRDAVAEWDGSTKYDPNSDGDVTKSGSVATFVLDASTASPSPATR
jgi:hypothetical protein